MVFSGIFKLKKQSGIFKQQMKLELNFQHLVETSNLQGQV